MINNLDEGLKLLRAWDILPAQTSDGPPSASKMDWHVVSHEKKNKQKKPDYLGYKISYRLLDSYSTVEFTVHKLPLLSNEQ